MVRVPNYMKREPPPFKNFFFLDGVLHRLLHVDRPNDIAICYNYGEQSEVRYHWHEVRKRKEPAYSIGQVSQMVGRSTKKIRDYIWEEEIETPPKSWKPGLDESRCSYWFSEKAIKELHEHIASIRKRRGYRKDRGDITGGVVPDPYQLRENLKKEVLYKRDKNGEFVPIWLAD